MQFPYLYFKNERNLITNYRPVSLLPICGKIVEKVIFDSLYGYIFKNNFIPDKQSSILDMGTGAGIPGLILAISNFTNVSLIDSNLKKINFIKSVCIKLNIEVKIYHQRIESLINKKFNYLISRALANLNNLFFYSQKLIDKNTVLIFLKGKHVKDEIHEASKCWKFQHF